VPPPQYPAAPQQPWQYGPQPGFQQAQPMPQPPAPKSGRFNRRNALIAAATALPVLGSLGYRVSRLGGSAQALGGGGVSGDDDPSTLPSAADAVNGISVAMVQSMLTQANQAIASGDPSGYVSLFTGAAARQAPATFKNMQKFDFGFAQFQLIDNVTRQFDAGDGASVNMDIAFVHQLKGTDAGKLAEWYRWTITKDGSGKPLVTKVTGSPSVNSFLKYTYYPMPWDSSTDIEVARQGSTVVCAEQPYASAVQQYLNTIATAVQDNRDEWSSGAAR
jgi:hypothetical protein